MWAFTFFLLQRMRAIDKLRAGASWNGRQMTVAAAFHFRLVSNKLAATALTFREKNWRL